MSRPRVGIVGARRRRQGLGPYVARDLAAAGADVPCFLAHRAETLGETRRGLAEAAGVDATGYLDLDTLLAECPVDALAILSPAETHARHLDRAARAGLHVLCEKPFVWGEPGLVERTGDLLARFAAAGRQVWENCQWPWTLPGFEALHPGALEHPPRRFAMELEPASRGLQSLADALPHALSLLERLVPGPARVEDPEFSTRDPRADALTIRFRYRTADRACEATVTLRATDRLPRRAAYALDDRRAERLVSPSDYRLSFADADRSVPIADPLTRLVADFVAALRDGAEGAASPTGDIQQRMQHLVALATAYAPEEIR
ncbi:MAG: Gfo/Idh/MocA family oxidoreductase [Myxococcota bacterium]